jgi:hypothetical protein
MEHCARLRFRRKSTPPSNDERSTAVMWILMLLIGLAAFALMFGFVFACDRL